MLSQQTVPLHLHCRLVSNLFLNVTATPLLQQRPDYSECDKLGGCLPIELCAHFDSQVGRQSVVVIVQTASLAAVHALLTFRAGEVTNLSPHSCLG